MPDRARTAPHDETFRPEGLPFDAGPLFVDLDGSLVRTDTLHESALRLLKTSPTEFIRALVTLVAHGIAAFKQFVAARSSVRPELLPYNEDVLAFLREEADRGRRIILATAADESVAQAVARHVGVFEAVLASDGETNLKSEAKAAAIRRYAGGEPFEYIGNSLSDVAIWKGASRAHVVNPSRGVERRLRREGVPIAEEFPSSGRLRAMARAARVYQWSKNVLVFGPALLSHRILEAGKMAGAVQVFAAFCAAASAIYVINDLLDIDADRQHPRKRNRPFAAGKLTIAQGIGLAIGLLGVCAAICLTMPPIIGLLLGLYAATSLVYTVYAKTHLFLDVITLAGLYTLRLLAGGAATEIVISPWTHAFSIFFFTSLASCKRLSELRTAAANNKGPLPGRGYVQTDLLSLTAVASSSGYAAVLVMALYVNSPEFVTLYRRPELMWCLVPLLAYWISRMIMISNRGEMHDDPIVFAMGDRASHVAGLGVIAVALASL